MSLYLTPTEEVIPTPGLTKIKEVRAYVSRSNEYGASDVHDTDNSHWIMGHTDANGEWDHKTSVYRTYTNFNSRNAFMVSAWNN